MAEHKDHYAIVIGIRNYAKMTPLLSAHEDAAGFIEWLKAPDGGGLPDENIIAIFSDEMNAVNYPDNVRPIRDTIDSALERLGIPDKVPVGERLYFYFSGHGFGKKFNEIGLLMADARPDALNANIGLDLYRSYLRDHSHFKEIVYILDCCRDPSPPNSSTFMVPPKFSASNASVPQGIQDFVIMGAAYGAKAFQGTAKVVGKRRGLLTAALLEGLNGQAADAHGRVTANSLRDFLQKRVPSLAKIAKIKAMEQAPEIEEPHGTNPFLFGTFAPPSVASPSIVPPSVEPHQVAITVATAGLQGELIVRHGGEYHELLRLNLGTANGEPWQFELPANSMYAIQHMPSNRFYALNPKEQNGEPFILETD